MENRKHFDEALMVIMSNKDYIKYSFYSFVISKMRVQITKEVPTAGAGFYNYRYNLLINPDFFAGLTLDERIAVLVHECQHVILQHIHRKGERDHKLFNIACDIAINQMIENIPEGGMFPATFDFPLNQTAEEYYRLLIEEQKEQEKEKADSDDSEGDSEGDSEDSEGSGDWTPSSGHPDLTKQDTCDALDSFDSHDFWGESSEEDVDLAKNMMEKIVQESMEKSIGNLPQNINDVLDLLKTKPKLSWKKILKRYVSSKKGKKTQTIKRRSRRLPNRPDVKGLITKYDTPLVVVGVDISGSMSDDEIQNALVEIQSICDLSNSDLKLVQIDTEIKGLETFDKKAKNFTRKGCGGTDMSAMARFLTDNKIKYDVLVMLSDMYIEDVGTHPDWRLKKPTIWLNTSGTDVSWEGVRGHKVYDLKNA